MRNIYLLAIALMMTLGCEYVDPVVKSPSPDETFKVAMLLPASIDDGGWNALAYDALLTIESQLGATISYRESLTPVEHLQDFRDYAQQGYDLIFGHGYEYQEPAIAVASDFPQTIFMATAGGTVAKNIATINFQLEQVTYLLGIIAGMMTRTDKIGVIGGQDLPSVNSTFLAFEAGVKSVNPDAVVRRDYVGNWHDTVIGREAADAQINAGIDFIFPNADAAGLGVFRAAEAAHAKGNIVYTFGSNRDQSAVSPTTILANAVITPHPFVEVAKLVRDGNWMPQVYTFTLSTDEAIALVYNPDLIDKIPQAVKESVAQAQAKILSGALQVPQIDFTMSSP